MTTPAGVAARKGDRGLTRWLHPLAAVLLVVVVLLHVRAELDTDFQVYSLMAHVIRAGGRPYQALFDHKPPVVYALLLPAAWSGLGHIAYAASGIALAAACHLPVFRLAAGIVGRSTAGWLAVGFTLASTVRSSWDYGYLNGLLNLLVLAFCCAGLSALRRVLGASGRRGPAASPVVLAALLGGLAFATRFSPSLSLITGGVGVVLALRWRWSPRSVLGWTFVVAALALAPGVVLLWALGSDASSAWRCLVEFNQLYGRVGQLDFGPEVPVWRRVMDGGLTLLKLGVLPLAAGGVGLFLAGRRRVPLLLGLLLPVSVISLEALLILPQGVGSKAYPYFTLLGLMSVVAGVTVDGALDRWGAWARSAGVLLLWLPWAPFCLSRPALPDRLAEQQPTALIRSIEAEDGALYTLTPYPLLYVYTARTPPVWFHAFNGAAWTWFGEEAGQVERTWRALEARPPHWLVGRADAQLGRGGARLLQAYEEAGRFQVAYPPGLSPERREVVLYRYSGAAD